MKTRRSNKSFESPPQRRRRKRKSLRQGKPLNVVNETITLSDSDEDIVELPIQNEDIQIVDSAEASACFDGSQNEFEDGEIIDEVGNETTEVCKSSMLVINSLENPANLPGRTASPLSPQKNNIESEVPVINIGDDESNQDSPVVVNCDDDDDDVEVLGVLVKTRPDIPLISLFSGNKRKRSSTKKDRRNSNGSGNNLSLMKGSIKRAKTNLRRSSSNTSVVSQLLAGGFYRSGNIPQPSGWQGIATTSKKIQRKKRKNKNKNKNRYFNVNQMQPHGWTALNRNRSREFDREVIFKLDRNPDPIEPEKIMVTVSNTPLDITPVPVFQPAHTSTPAAQVRRNEERGAWMQNPNRNFKQHPAPIAPGSNIMTTGETVDRPQGSLRPIVIDGSNIAFGHGGMLQGGPKFSARGIQICVDYFLKRGHKEIVAFVPRYRLKKSECRDPELLEEMETAGHVRFTPSREAGGHRIASYDDLFVVEYANETGGVIISNDNFRDLFDRSAHLRDTIKFRILQYTWVTQHTLMFPSDPLGRIGPSLDQFLRF